MNEWKNNKENRIELIRFLTKVGEWYKIVCGYIDDMIRNYPVGAGVTINTSEVAEELDVPEPLVELVLEHFKEDTTLDPKPPKPTGFSEN